MEPFKQDDAVLKLMRNRLHPRVKAKSDLWKELIRKTYIGGKEYTSGKFLDKYPRENDLSYTARRDRSVFFNHTAPLVDQLVGFVFEEKPQRIFPEKLQYLITNASRGKSLDAFMYRVCVSILLYPIGVLVDSPSFDPEEIKSDADRQEAGIQCFAVLYFPWEIRDLACDDAGELEWILLDNSFVDKSNPMEPEKPHTMYRLWTREFFQDFEYYKQGEKDTAVVHEPVFHNLGVVPIVFGNSRDTDDEQLGESVFEDIALLDKLFYNTYSAMDEGLVAGSFKMCFFPIETINDLPGEIQKEGLGALAVIPFNGKLANKPYFDGSGMGEIQNFITVLQFLLREMFTKVGLSRDDDKPFVQSGAAKQYEFRKTEAILRVVAEQLENIEHSIFYFASKWEKIESPDIDITYNKIFNREDVETTLQRLYEVMALPIRRIQDEAIKLITEKVFSDKISAKTLEELTGSISTRPADESDDHGGDTDTAPSGDIGE